MGLSGGVISKPVSVTDVRTVLASGSNDVGTLCKHTNINMWSRYKPVVSQKIEKLTDADFQAAKMGLSPINNDKALAVMSKSTSTSISSQGWQNIINKNTPWTYSRPTGGAASPYRLADFDGYNHNTTPPVSGFRSWDVKSSALQSIYNARVNQPTPSTNSYNQEWPVAGIKYPTFNCKFGPGTTQTLGSTHSAAIPLTWILGGLESEYWRLCLGVRVADNQPLYIVPGNVTLKTALENPDKATATYLVPNLSANQYLAYKLYEAAGFTGAKWTAPFSAAFQAIPLLVRNVFKSEVRNSVANDGSTWSYPIVDGTGLAYSMPANNTVITINITNDTTYNANELRAFTHFEVASRNTGQQATIGGTVFNIKEIYIKVKQDIPQAYNYTLSYSFESSFIQGGSGNTPQTNYQTLSGTLTVRAGTKAGTVLTLQNTSQATRPNHNVSRLITFSATESSAS